MDYDDEEPTAEEAEDEAPSEEDPDTLTPVTDYGAEAEEEAQKLSKAEELLRAARERIGRSEQDAENEYPRTPSADYDEETEEARKLSEAEELLRAFVHVEVVFAEEAGNRTIIMENDHGETIDALTNLGVLLLGWGFVRAGAVVKPYQLHVVCTLGGSHVRLIAERRNRDGSIPYLEGVHR